MKLHSSCNCWRRIKKAESDVKWANIRRGTVAKPPFHPYRVSKSRLSSRNFTCAGTIEASTRKLDCCASILGNPFPPRISGDAMVSVRPKVRGDYTSSSRSREHPGAGSPRNGASASEVALCVAGVTASVLSAENSEYQAIITRRHFRHPANPPYATFSSISQPFYFLTIDGYFF